MASAAQTALERLSAIERPVRLIVEIVLIFCLALLIARMGWLIISPEDSVARFTDRPLPSPLEGKAGALGLVTDRTVLIRANPFRQGESDAIIVEEAPETTLNLKLDGLRASTGQEDSGTAIIRGPNGVGKGYSVGDEILAGVTLRRILSDRVIIDRDGASETLMRGDRNSGLTVIGDGSQVAADRSAGEPSSLNSNAGAAQPQTIEREITDPEALLSSVSVQPVEENGRISGYRLTPLGSSDTMAAAGLRPGDVLLQINGASVANRDLPDLIAEIGSRETAELQIERDGSVQTIRLSFKE